MDHSVQETYMQLKQEDDDKKDVEYKRNAAFAAQAAQMFPGGIPMMQPG